MRTARGSAQSTSVILIKICRKLALFCSPVLLLLLWPTASVMAQSTSTPPAQSQTPSQNQTQNQTQSQSQSLAQPGSAPQVVSGDQQQSLADAARKVNAQKDKPKAKHVFTDDDVSSIPGTISVVGSGSVGGSSAGNRPMDDGSQANAPVSSSGAGKDEAYWRGRAQQIKNQMAAIDQKIAQVKAEIAKSGAVQMDPSSGAMQSVVIIHDRNAEVKDLEDQKAGCQKQLEDLAEEGRKAGADSGWFR